MFLKLIARFFAALNSNAKKEQIAAGIACGLLLGLVPVGNLLWIALFLLTFFFKIHYGMQMLAMALFKLLALPLAPLVDKLGWAVLNAPFLQPAFTSLADMPIAPLTRFNNTLVMGGLLVGIVLWVPAFFGFRSLVILYRKKLLPKLEQTKFYKAFMKLPGVAKLAGSVASISGMGKD